MSGTTKNRLLGDWGFWRDDFMSLKISLRENGIPSGRLSAYELTEGEWAVLIRERPEEAEEMRKEGL